MRARAVAAVLSLVPILVGAQQRRQDTRPGIAVLPFSNGGSYGQAKEDYDALQRGIAGMMISELARNPAARIVERERFGVEVGRFALRDIRAAGVSRHPHGLLRRDDDRSDARPPNRLIRRAGERDHGQSESQADRE